MAAATAYPSIPPHHAHETKQHTHQTHTHTHTQQVVVFGFTYLDTLKICLRKEWNAHGVHFLGKGDARDMKALEEILRGEQIMGLFTGAWV